MITRNSKKKLANTRLTIETLESRELFAVAGWNTISFHGPDGTRIDQPTDGSVLELISNDREVLLNDNDNPRVPKYRRPNDPINRPPIVGNIVSSPNFPNDNGDRVIRDFRWTLPPDADVSGVQVITLDANEPIHDVIPFQGQPFVGDLSHSVQCYDLDSGLPRSPGVAGCSPGRSFLTVANHSGQYIDAVDFMITNGPVPGRGGPENWDVFSYFIPDASATPTGGSTVVREGGGTDTVQLSLASSLTRPNIPASAGWEVVFNVTSSNPSQLEVVTPTVTITEANWTGFPIEVRAVDDGVTELNPVDASIQISVASSTDGLFDAFGSLPPVAVTVLDNDASAANDTYSLSEDTTLDVPAPGVLGNDNSQSPLTPVIIGQAENGFVALDSDGSFTYQPDPNFNGTDRFTYQVSNGFGGVDSATVTLNVMPVPDDVIAEDDTYLAVEDNILTVSAPGLIDNDMNVDGIPIHAVLVSAPSQGELELNADGSFVYEPDLNYCDTDSFEYILTDVDGVPLSDPANVHIEVVCENDAPVVNDDFYEVGEDGLLIEGAPGVLDNDTDVDGDSLNAILVSGPNHGTIALNPDGGFIYVPDPDYAGPDQFVYAADDGNLSDTATVFIDVIFETEDGDFDNDDDYDCDDIDALVAEIAGGTGNPLFDLTGDGIPNIADLNAWLLEAGEFNLGEGRAYLRGDANLDGIVDGQDFIIWNNNKFTADAGWCGGDFNADGITDGQDFILWNANKFQSADGSAFVHGRIPEKELPSGREQPTVPFAAVDMAETSSEQFPRLAARRIGPAERSGLSVRRILDQLEDRQDHELSAHEFLFAQIGG